MSDGMDKHVSKDNYKSCGIIKTDQRNGKHSFLITLDDNGNIDVGSKEEQCNCQQSNCNIKSKKVSRIGKQRIRIALIEEDAGSSEEDQNVSEDKNDTVSIDTQSFEAMHDRFVKIYNKNLRGKPSFVVLEDVLMRKRIEDTLQDHINRNICHCHAQQQTSPCDIGAHTGSQTDEFLLQYALCSGMKGYSSRGCQATDINFERPLTSTNISTSNRCLTVPSLAGLQVNNQLESAPPTNTAPHVTISFVAPTTASIPSVIKAHEQQQQQSQQQQQQQQFLQPEIFLVNQADQQPQQLLQPAMTSAIQAQQQPQQHPQQHQELHQTTSSVIQAHQQPHQLLQPALTSAVHVQQQPQQQQQLHPKTSAVIQTLQQPQQLLQPALSSVVQGHRHSQQQQILQPAMSTVIQPHQQAQQQNILQAAISTSIQSHQHQQQQQQHLLHSAISRSPGNCRKHNCTCSNCNNCCLQMPTTGHSCYYLPTTDSNCTTCFIRTQQQQQQQQQQQHHHHHHQHHQHQQHSCNNNSCMLRPSTAQTTLGYGMPSHCSQQILLMPEAEAQRQHQEYPIGNWPTPPYSHCLYYPKSNAFGLPPCANWIMVDQQQQQQPPPPPQQHQQQYTHQADNNRIDNNYAKPLAEAGLAGNKTERKNRDQSLEMNVNRMPLINGKAKKRERHKAGGALPSSKIIMARFGHTCLILKPKVRTPLKPRLPTNSKSRD